MLASKKIKLLVDENNIPIDLQKQLLREDSPTKWFNEKKEFGVLFRL